MKETPKIKLQAELEHRILRGLSCEWDNFANDLDLRYRRLMQKPLFSIRNMKRRLGCWFADEGEIRISRQLVMNHPWDSVCDVLRHEMAHQLTEQVFGVRHETSHGSTFQMACRMLKANPRASGTYPTLRERLEGGRHDSRDKIMLRVKKLLALAESSNSHEAEAAMVKAHQLIAKYNLELISSNVRREFASIYLGEPALRHWREDYRLSNLIQTFYFVDGIWVPAYVIQKGKMGRVLEISGTPKNLKIAEYVHAFIRQFIDHQWCQYNQDKGLNRYRKTDFALGIIDGFKAKLAASQKPAAPIHTAGQEVIALEDPQLKWYMHQRYPRTVSLRSRALNSDRVIHQDGVSIGHKLVIAEGVTEFHRGRVLHIEGPREDG